MIKGEKLDCKECRKLLNQDAFPAGFQVRIVLDCETCPIAQTVPIPENEQILDLYQDLPQTFDSFGSRIISLEALNLIFMLNDIPKELQDDYGKRILYFNSRLIREKYKIEKKKAEREKNKKK